MVEQMVALATGLMTLAAMWLAGSKRRAGWGLSLVNQAMWLTFIIMFEAWGLLPLTVALTFVFARNLIVWRDEPEVGPVAVDEVIPARSGEEAPGRSGRVRVIQPQDWQAPVGIEFGPGSREA